MPEISDAALQWILLAGCWTTAAIGYGVAVLTRRKRASGGDR